MHWLITGGAGFIGANTAARVIQRGDTVTIVDDLSRPGAQANLEWLRTLGAFRLHHVDVSHFDDLERAFTDTPPIHVVLHLAAQVAVTASVTDPRRDFEVNALGTFNVLEAVRRHAPDVVLLNASTNKVYGGMDDLRIAMCHGRYAFAGAPRGVSEDRPLDFHSPYGCSKGAADQYVLDYARVFKLRSVSFRQSCIYGPRQHGVEDQGWVAWFTIAAVSGRPVVVYGDGRQVRDLLYVDDLVDCYFRAVDRIDGIAGRCYNIGGGPANAMSLLELLDFLEHTLGRPITRTFADWRPGDQKVFVCDISRATSDLDWSPRTSTTAGVNQLIDWVRENAEWLAQPC